MALSHILSKTNNAEDVMFRNCVFYLIAVGVVVFVGLAVYHFISLDPIEHLGEWELHPLFFEGKVPKPVVLKSFRFNNPTYRVEGELQKIGDSGDDFSTVLVAIHGNDVQVLAVTDDDRTYFASERIIPVMKSIKYLADVERVEVGESFEDGFSLRFYYAKNWSRTIAVSILCVLVGLLILLVSHKVLYRRREKSVAQHGMV